MQAIGVALAAALIVFATANTNEVRLPEIKVGTNTYKRATITKRNPLEAVIRYDGGITEGADRGLTTRNRKEMVRPRRSQ